MTARARIEDAFTRWCEVVLAHRAWVLAGSLALVATLSIGLSRLEIETSFESYLPDKNPARQIYERFRHEFGSGERVVFLLRPSSLYEPRFLEDLRALHVALEEELPYVDKITSLVNARYLIGTSETLESESLLDQPPHTESDLQRLRRRVRSNPLYRNVIVSADESSTTIVVELDGSLGPSTPSFDPIALDTDDSLIGFENEPDGTNVEFSGEMLTTEQSRHLARAIDEILERHTPRSAELFVAGTPLLAQRLGEMLTRDIVLFVAISLLFTATLLFLLFQSVWAMLNPLIVVVLSVIGTLGWMGLVGIPLTAVTEILPSLLVAIGVGDAVHIQSMFYKHHESGHNTRESIIWAMGHSGLAVILTSLTTAASMAAFQVAQLRPIIDLGRAAPVGVALALLFSTTLLPVLLSLTPMQKHADRGSRLSVSSHIDVALMKLGHLGTRHPWKVLVAVGLLWVAAGMGVARLHFSQKDLSWLPPEDSIRIATEEINRSMKGAESFELLVDLEDDIDLREPKVLEALREIERRTGILRMGELVVGQSISLVDVIEETHRALGDDPEARLELPTSREAVSQELLLFESAAPDDLERLVDSEMRTTRIAMTVPFVDALYYPRFARAVTKTANQVLTERGLRDAIDVVPTGLLTLAGETFSLLFTSMARSYAIAFGVIALLLLVLIGDLELGLLSMLPNITPIFLVLGLMGWIDAPLDISSILVGGILIGVVVDDTIHFAHNFARYRLESGCSLHAVRETLATTGRAMFVTSVVLSIGFFAFAGAWLSNIAEFGIFCGLGVLLAFLADIVMLPALISIASPCATDCPAHESHARPA